MQQDLLLQSYDYHLPRENIAQHPAEQRDKSKLLILNRQSGHIEHKQFHDIINLISPGDLLVINNTRVFPARLLGRKKSGGKVEVFLLEFPKSMGQHKHKQGWITSTVTALLKSSKRPRPGIEIRIGEELFCTVMRWYERGKAQIELHSKSEHELTTLLHSYGQVPLPPYIQRETGTTDNDLKRYQTVYAHQSGAVAAPTAGLHFTEPLLSALGKKGILTAEITLHVGYGTFAPVRVDTIKDHIIHEEHVHISEQTAALINETKKAGGKVWAVGTTTVRTLEYAVNDSGLVEAMEGPCDLYIIPGFQFKIIDNLITNFHLPQSSLLFLVSALCGRKKLLDCYQEAIDNDYRFYSYGDAMVVVD